MSARQAAGGRRSAGPSGRQLATIFFTDMVGSTELAARLGDRRWRALLATYQSAVRRAIKRFGGREIDSAGDGFFASFPQPAGAIACACALQDQLHAEGIEVRTGLHMGEAEIVGRKLGGIAVHIGARVVAAAGPGELVVSSTIRDVVSGADNEFVDLGMHTLKGVPGEWRLFRVEWPGSVPLDREALARWDVAPPRGVRLLRRYWVGGAAVAVAGVVVVIVLLLVVGRGAAAVVVGPDSVAGVDVGKNAFSVDYSVGGHPDGVAVGGGSVWVINAASQTMSRIDVQTGATSPAVSVGGAPTGIAAGGGSVWVAVAGTGELLRFDDTTGSLRDHIAVPDGVGRCAFGDGALWVVDALDNAVLRVDAVTETISTITTSTDPVGVAAGASGVWVVDGVDRALQRIDPATLRVSGKSIALDAQPAEVALSDSGVWVLSTAGASLTEIDPSTEATVTSIKVDSGASALTVADGSVWVAAATAQNLERIAVAPPNTVTARLSVQGHPADVAASGGTLWVVVSR